MGHSGNPGTHRLDAFWRAAGAAAPGWDRFATWPQSLARLVLAVVALMMIAAAWVPQTVGHGEVASVPSLITGGKERPRDGDLALYDTAVHRIRAGENYYSFIVAEHRRQHYPVRPGLAVRLPTMAYLDAAMGAEGDATAPLAVGIAAALMAAVVYVWWQRLAAEGCSPEQRRFGAALVFLGGSLGLARYYFVLHELWAGMLIALSFGLYRTNRWGPAWWAAALALAIRELTLPFVLLMAAQALWRWHAGDRAARRESLAWSGLAVAFGIGLGIHLHLIALQTLPSDPLGPSWLAMRGLDGWLSNVILSSDLRFLPHWAAGPLVILMLLGWAGWRSAAGAFGILLYMGYGVAFMIAGRNDNFYWGAMITPALYIGLAFAPMAAASLVRAAWGTRPLELAQPVPAG